MTCKLLRSSMSVVARGNMKMEHWQHDTDIGSRPTRKTTCPCVILSTTNRTRTGKASNTHR
jgi:hypothetical protein